MPFERDMSGSPYTGTWRVRSSPHLNVDEIQNLLLFALKKLFCDEIQKILAI
jgi:hypothetical protein